MMRRLAVMMGLVALFAATRLACADPQAATLRIALERVPNNLNPMLAASRVEEFLGALAFDSLVYSTPDGMVRPVLAAVVPTQANGGISRDGRTIVYKLRHGVRWHDGVPFTSRDVAFSQRASVDLNNNVTARDPYRFVTYLNTPDDYTVVIHLAKPYAPFVAEYRPGILPEHLLAKESELNDVAFNASPVGTGPFIFDHWYRGREIVYRANDQYFLGKPKVHRIVVQLMPNENTRNVALETDETDWSFEATTTSARQFAGHSNIVTELLTENGYYFLGMETRRPPLDDLRVRRAIAHALDVPSMVQKLSGDFAIPATSDLGPATWGYDPAVRRLPFDISLSRAFLASGGWKLGANGILERDSRPLSLDLVYVESNTSSQAYALQVQSRLRDVGIDVVIKPEQANILFAPLAAHGTLASGNFDLSLYGLYNFADPNDRREFGCTSLPPNGFNFSRWCNPEYESVTKDALAHVDRATRKRDYTRASEILIDDVPGIFLYWYKDVELLRPGVHIDDGANNIALPYLWHEDP
jgi:peptide/nickel transport system substrate-binding protein